MQILEYKMTIRVTANVNHHDAWLTDPGFSHSVARRIDPAASALRYTHAQYVLAGRYTHAQHVQAG